MNWALAPEDNKLLQIICRTILKFRAERLAAQGEKILAFLADNYCWRDLGRPADLTQAALNLKQEVLL
jgi:hypothetical protein